MTAISYCIVSDYFVLCSTIYRLQLVLCGSGTATGLPVPLLSTASARAAVADQCPCSRGRQVQYCTVPHGSAHLPVDDYCTSTVAVQCCTAVLGLHCWLALVTASGRQFKNVRLSGIIAQPYNLGSHTEGPQLITGSQLN